jgi:hypothetical protein
VSSGLDLIPVFFQILSQAQQNQLLGYLLAGFKDSSNESRHIIGNTLTAMMRQYPNYAEQIFNDITSYLRPLLTCRPIIDKCGSINTFEPFTYFSVTVKREFSLFDPNVSILMGSFCGERAMLACEAKHPRKTEIEQLIFLVKSLELFPNVLIPIMVGFIYSSYKPKEKKQDTSSLSFLSSSSSSSSSTNMNLEAKSQAKSRSLSLGALTGRSLTEGVLMPKGKVTPVENKSEVIYKRRQSASF